MAATSNAIARKALKLIDVEYEVLPHVIDPVEAMADNAPILHDNLFTAGITPTPTKPSNVASRMELNKGDLDKGFAEADLIVEREFTTAPVHQGYIEPHACLAVVNQDRQAELWVTTQGHWIVRAHCARLLGWDSSQIKVTSSEIGVPIGITNISPVSKRASSTPPQLVDRLMLSTLARTAHWRSFRLRPCQKWSRSRCAVQKN